MPTERMSMPRICELLLLKFENGLGSRLIAASLGMSKGAVGEYLQRSRPASWVMMAPMQANSSVATDNQPISDQKSWR